VTYDSINWRNVRTRGRKEIYEGAPRPYVDWRLPDHVSHIVEPEATSRGVSAPIIRSVPITSTLFRDDPSRVYPASAADHGRPLLSPLTS
jgi:hypothetical protein